MSTPTTPASPTIRPYTSYNLFFQLEREYILQTLLKFQPTISSADLFNPADKTNYQGPPLPPRFADLQLLSDWHIPGKTLRRKRIHRKSHGKIGFHELNERISKGWQDVDDVTRSFCVALSEFESKKYKLDRKEKKKKTEQKQKTRVVVAKKQQVKKTIKNELKEGEDGLTDLFGICGNCDSNNNFPQQDISASVVKSPLPEGEPRPKLSRQVSHDLRQSFNESFNSSYVSLASSPPGLSDSFNTSFNSSFNESLREVDIEDDEIIEMYKSMAIEEGINIPSMMLEICQVCMEIVTPQTNKSTITKSQDGLAKQLAKEQHEEVKDDKRRSFIDAEYEMFQEIGKQFSSKTTKMPAILRRNSITACKA